MLDNTFKLTIDILFPPPISWPNSKKHCMPNKVKANIFELIFDDNDEKKPFNVDDTLRDPMIIMQMG